MHPFNLHRLKNSQRSERLRGFTLVELLVVVALTVTLMALVVPSIGYIVASSRLTQAGGWIVDEINNARATALARNLPVELWFLRTTGDGGDPVAYRMIRTRLIEANGNMPWISRNRRLPQGVVISPSVERSNCIGGQTEQTITDIPGASNGVAIRIYPNGRTEPVNPTGVLKLNDPLFLTVGAERDVGNTGNDLPANFITIQIEPRNGRVTFFQP